MARQSFFKRPEMGRFIFKALLLLLGMVALWRAFTSRYLIGFDPQQTRCLPNCRLFLVDTKDNSRIPGKLYVFSARETEPVIADGTWMVKRLVALPGDLVAINNDDLKITVNGRMVGGGLARADKLGPSKSHFCGTKNLPLGHYWFLGESENSFDSRYWGSVKDEQIIGRAWPLF